MPTVITDTTKKAIEAEVRFVEEGHRVNFDAGTRHFVVVSDSRPGLRYEIAVYRQGAELRGTCTCPAGTHARHGKPVPCKHVAGVMRRGERERWARWDGWRWVATGVAAA